MHVVSKTRNTFPVRIKAPCISTGKNRAGHIMPKYYSGRHAGPPGRWDRSMHSTHTPTDYLMVLSQLHKCITHTLLLFNIKLSSVSIWYIWATSAVQKPVRGLSRCRRKPDHYRKGDGCNFWFRHSKNKTYSCTKNYLSIS